MEARTPTTADQIKLWRQCWDDAFDNEGSWQPDIDTTDNMVDLLEDQQGEIAALTEKLDYALMTVDREKAICEQAESNWKGVLRQRNWACDELDTHGIDSTPPEQV